MRPDTKASLGQGFDRSLEESSIQSKEFLRRFSRGPRYFLQTHTARSRYGFGDQPRVCGLAALSPVGSGGEIRAIGFHHELAQCQARCDLTHGDAILKRHDPGKRNQMTECDYFFRLLFRAAEAMKDTANLSSVITDD